MSKDIKYRILTEHDSKGTNAARKGFLSLRSVARSTFSGISRAASSAFRAVRTGATIAVGALNAFGVWSVKTASDAEEMDSKFDAVFKSLALGAREWSRGFATEVKRSEYDIRSWMSTIQDTLVPMGLARSDASELSKSVTRLAVDLSSFNNLPTGDVIRDIQSALVGNHETMRKYGVVISETTLKAAAMAHGISKTGKDLSEQEKLLTRLKMIQEGTTDAQGDASRTAGSFANRIRGLQSAFQSFRVEVGKQIIDGADLGNVLDKLTAKTAAFMKSLKESGVVEHWARRAKEMLEAIALVAKAGTEDKETRGQVFESLGKLLVLYLKKGAETFITLMAKAMPVLGRILGQTASGILSEIFSQRVEVKDINRDMSADEISDTRKSIEGNPERLKALQKELQERRDNALFETELSTLNPEDKDQGRKAIEAREQLKTFEAGLKSLGFDPDKVAEGRYNVPDKNDSALSGIFGDVSGEIDAEKAKLSQIAEDQRKKDYEPTAIVKAIEDMRQAGAKDFETENFLQSIVDQKELDTGNVSEAEIAQRMRMQRRDLAVEAEKTGDTADLDQFDKMAAKLNASYRDEKGREQVVGGITTALAQMEKSITSARETAARETDVDTFKKKAQEADEKARQGDSFKQFLINEEITPDQIRDKKLTPSDIAQQLSSRRKELEMTSSENEDGTWTAWRDGAATTYDRDPLAEFDKNMKLFAAAVRQPGKTADKEVDPIQMAQREAAETVAEDRTERTTKPKVQIDRMSISALRDYAKTNDMDISDWEKRFAAGKTDRNELAEYINRERQQRDNAADIRDQLTGMSKDELLEVAGKAKVKGDTTTDRADLIAGIEAAVASQPQTEEPAFEAIDDNSNMDTAAKAITRQDVDLGEIFTRMYGQAGPADPQEDMARRQLSFTERIAKNTDHLNKIGLK